MITLVIFSVISGAIISVLMVGLSSYQIGEARTQGQQDVRFAMQAMTKELRLSKGDSTHLQILDDSGSVAFSGTHIRFQVPLRSGQETQLDSNNDMVWGADGHQNYWVAFELVDVTGKTTHQLRRIVYKENKTAKATDITEKILANNIESMGFRGLPDNTYSPRCIEIVVTGSNTGNAKTITSVLKSRVWVRN